MRSRDLLSANASCASAVPLILSVALLLAMPLAHGNISVEWTPCECNSPTYTLTAYTSGYGTVSKSPDKAAYSKGEAVIVTFTPNADRVFTYWYGSPPSHLAHLSEETAAVVFMTANTILIPVTEAKTKTLYVNWDTARGTVELPPGGQGGSGSFTAPVSYGETITLTATPNSGSYTVWVGQYPNDASGERYGNSVNVKMLSANKLTADFRENAQYPGTMNTLTLNTNGGEADVFSSGALTASFSSGTYPYNSATGPSRFSFLFSARKGYAWKYLTWMADGQARYTTSTGITFYPGATFTGHLVEKVRLNLETEGQGVVSSPQFQYWWNPQPYNPVALTNPPATSITPNVNANAVTMTPSACTGWSFDHWEYKNAQGEWISTPGTNLTIYMNWWAGTGIRVPSGETLFNVKAVFGMLCPCGPHECPERCAGGTALSAGELTQLHGPFPMIQSCNVKKTDEATVEYDCFGWALGDMENHTYADFDTDPPYGLVEVQEVVACFSQSAQKPYILYGDLTDLASYGGIYSQVRHAAAADAPCEAACAESKLGPWIRVVHDAAEMSDSGVPSPECASYGCILIEGTP